MATYPHENCCPIHEQTGDGTRVGRCFVYLVGGICSRHGDVAAEVRHFVETGKMTLENDMRKRKGLPPLGEPK